VAGSSVEEVNVDDGGKRTFSIGEWGPLDTVEPLVHLIWDGSSTVER
jgi:hypothetical protein